MTSAYRELKDFVRRRNEALAKLDIAYARRMMPEASSDEVLLIMLHKARYETPEIDPALRRDSRAWLTAHGYGRHRGLPWPEGDLLPYDANY